MPAEGQNTYIAHKIRAVPPTRNLNFEVSRVTAQKADFSAIEEKKLKSISTQMRKKNVFILHLQISSVHYKWPRTWTQEQRTLAEMTKITTKKSRDYAFQLKKLLKANQHDWTFRFHWADLTSDYAYIKKTTRNLPRTTEKPRDRAVVAFFHFFCRNALFFSRKTYIITTTAWPIGFLFGSMLKTAFNYLTVKLLR